MDEKIAFVADMHLEPMEAGRSLSQGINDLPPRRAAQLEQALQQIYDLQPVAVLLGGDNANRVLTRPDHLRFIDDFLTRFPQPRYAIPGNHDVGSTVGWPRHDREEMARCCATFREHFGPDRWVLEAAGFRVIAINSQITASGLPDDAGQRSWLRAQLAEPSSLLRVLFMHTPPYLRNDDDNFDDGSEMMCLKPPARAPVLALLEENPPDLLITAHVHRFWTRRGPPWDWLALPSTAFSHSEMEAVPSHNTPRGEDCVGWVSLSRDGAGWAATLHRLDDQGDST